MNVEGGERVWQVFVLRNLNNWEIGEYRRQLNILSCGNLDESNDIPLWCIAKNRSFTVKLATSIFSDMKIMM